MAHHHDDHGHGHNEQKPVSFTVPLILGAVTVLIIVLLVSLGNPSHHGKCECADAAECSKECMEACEKGDHNMHPAEMKHGEGHDKHAEETAPVEAAKDSAAVEPTEHTAEPVKEEAHH